MCVSVCVPFRANAIQKFFFSDEQIVFPNVQYLHENLCEVLASLHLVGHAMWGRVKWSVNFKNSTNDRNKSNIAFLPVIFMQQQSKKKV